LKFDTCTIIGHGCHAIETIETTTTATTTNRNRDTFMGRQVAAVETGNPINVVRRTQNARIGELSRNVIILNPKTLRLTYTHCL